MKKIKIVLADDHAVVRAGLKTILGLEKDFHVIGEAENAISAARLAGELRPDVVILDLMMPGSNGAEAVRRIRRENPDTRILILTSYGTSAEIRFALDAGASGAVTKNLSNAQLTEAIRKTAVGECVLSQEIKGALSEADDEPTLNERQHVIVESIMRGLSNGEIAAQLGISRTRVKQHLSEVFQALGATNRTEAVAVALRKHLLKI